MSVQSYKSADGTRWRVRWREADGSMRSKTVASKRAALALDADVKTRKFKGDALPKPGRETLAEAYEEWWRLRGSSLAKNTQAAHRSVWNAHVKGRHDHHRLNELVANPQIIEEITADMRARGVGNAAQRRTLAVLSAVLTAAVQWNKIAVNPVRSAPKPPNTRQRVPQPMAPLVIERIRLQMLRRRTLDDTTERNCSDACLVVLMAYAGLRPGEALALTWGDVGTRTLTINKAMSVGEESTTKTGVVRFPPLVDELAADLDTLRSAQGDPTDDRRLFPGAKGDLWSATQYRNWRTRVWKPVLTKLAEGDPPQPGLAKARPYDCRGSFVSLHLRAKENPLVIAEWAGHSPQVMYEHYAGVIKELDEQPQLSAAQQIARARNAVVEMERQELDELMADLAERPTVSVGGAGTGDEDEGPRRLNRAANIFYGPADL